MNSLDHYIIFNLKNAKYAVTEIAEQLLSTVV